MTEMHDHVGHGHESAPGAPAARSHPRRRLLGRYGAAAALTLGGLGAFAAGAVMAGMLGGTAVSPAAVHPLLAETGASDAVPSFPSLPGGKAFALSGVSKKVATVSGTASSAGARTTGSTPARPTGSSGHAPSQGALASPPPAPTSSASTGATSKGSASTGTTPQPVSATGATLPTTPPATPPGVIAPPAVTLPPLPVAHVAAQGETACAGTSGTPTSPTESVSLGGANGVEVCAGS